MPSPLTPEESGLFRNNLSFSKMLNEPLGVGGMPRTIPHEVHTGTLPYWKGSHGTSVLEGIPCEGSHRTQLSHVKVHMGHGHPWKFWHTSLYRAQNTIELIPTIDIEQQLGNLFAPLQNT
ncbi:hypothetical protein J3A83DRAFT_4407049 [Scleroderma citrinum]